MGALRYRQAEVWLNDDEKGGRFPVKKAVDLVFHASHAPRGALRRRLAGMIAGASYTGSRTLWPPGPVTTPLRIPGNAHHKTVPLDANSSAFYSAYPDFYFIRCMMERSLRIKLACPAPVYRRVRVTDQVMPVGSDLEAGLSG